MDSSQPGFSSIAITGYRSLGVTNVPNSDNSTNIQLSGDVSWSRSAHTIKTGVQAYWMRTDFLSSQRSSGVFNFNGRYHRRSRRRLSPRIRVIVESLEVGDAEFPHAVYAFFRAGRLARRNV